GLTRCVARLPVEILRRAGGLPDPALRLGFVIARDPAKTFFHLTANILGSTRHAILIHFHIPLTARAYNPPAAVWFERIPPLGAGQQGRLNAGGLIARDFHAGCNHRAIRGHWTAACRSTFARDNSSISSRPTIGGKQHLIVRTFDAAACLVTLCPHDANAK